MTSAVLNSHLAQLGWSSVKQVFRITRERTTRDRETGCRTTSVEVAYGITSLPRFRANAAKLLALVRGHWGIENSLHWVRDETFGEDRCRIRMNHGPQQLATARNIVITLCRAQNHQNLAAARRDFAWNPSRLFASLGLVTN